MPVNRENAIADMRADYDYLRRLSFEHLVKFADEKGINYDDLDHGELLSSVCRYLGVSRRPGRSALKNAAKAQVPTPDRPLKRTSSRPGVTSPYARPLPRTDLNTRRRVKALTPPPLDDEPDDGAINAPSPESSPEPEAIERRGLPASEESLRQTVHMLAEFRRCNEQLARQCAETILNANKIRETADNLRKALAVQTVRRARIEPYLMYWRSQSHNWELNAVFPDIPVYLRKDTKNGEEIEVDAADVDEEDGEELRKFMDVTRAAHKKKLEISDDAPLDAEYVAVRSKDDLSEEVPKVVENTEDDKILLDATVLQDKDKDKEVILEVNHSVPRATRAERRAASPMYQESYCRPQPGIDRNETTSLASSAGVSPLLMWQEHMKNTGLGPRISEISRSSTRMSPLEAQFLCLPKESQRFWLKQFSKPRPSATQGTDEMRELKARHLSQLPKVPLFSESEPRRRSDIQFPSAVPSSAFLNRPQSSQSALGNNSRVSVPSPDPRASRPQTPLRARSGVDGVKSSLEWM